VQRPGQRDPLLLAAGQLMGIPLAHSAQAHRLQQAGDLAAAAFPGGKPEPDIALDGQVREQAAVLGDVTDPASFRRGVDTRTVDQDIADLDRARVRAVEAGQQPEQRRLPAARRPQDRRQGPGRHLQVHAGQDWMGAEGLIQAGNRQLPHALIPALESGD
jgi:hypothetical protein